MQTRQAAWNVVREVRTTLAAVIPTRIKHEVVDDQLLAAVKEIEQADLAVRAIEDVLLVNPDHRQSAAFRIEPVSRVGSFLLFKKQVVARDKPLIACNNSRRVHPSLLCV